MVFIFFALTYLFDSSKLTRTRQSYLSKQMLATILLFFTVTNLAQAYDYYQYHAHEYDYRDDYGIIEEGTHSPTTVVTITEGIRCYLSLYLLPIAFLLTFYFSSPLFSPLFLTQYLTLHCLSSTPCLMFA